MAEPVDYIPTRYKAQRVSVREKWADDWSPVAFLWCDRLDFALSPAIGTAELSWRYGRGARPGELAVGVVSPLDLAGWYVRIEIVGGPTWYGVIQEEIDARGGSVLVDDADGDPVRVPSGSQSLVALSLEWLLTQTVVTESVVAQSGGDETIGRAIAFNGSDGRRDQSSATAGNCSPAVGDAGVRVFADQLGGSAAVQWLGGFIIAYLLQFFGPRDKNGAAALPLFLRLGESSTALNYSVPTLEADGRTVKEIVDDIVARRRGLGWRLIVELDPDDGTENVFLTLSTFARTRIVLDSGAEIPANLDQRWLDWDFDRDVVSLEIRKSSVDTFDQVIARGARRGSVVTLSPADGTLAADWSSTLETAYEAAATTAPGYGAWSAIEKVAHHDDYRAGDVFERVWSWFVLPAAWDGDVGDGIGGTKYRAFPTLDAAGVPTTTSGKFWRAGLRFEPMLPFLVGHDYSGSRIADGTVDKTDPTGSQPEYLAPFVLLPSRSGEWQHAERFDAASSAGDSDRPHIWACNVAMRADDAGVVLSVVGGKQHYLGSADFNANADDDAATFAIQAVDWNDIIATVYVLSDEHVDARYPADSALPDSDTIRRRVLSVPDAFLDYVPPGTVVARTVTGGCDRVTTGGFVRDDRDRLQSIARTAFAWYGVPRRKLTARIRGVRTDAVVGSMIIRVGSGAAAVPDVNAVVTSLRYDLISNTTTIQTDHANLDAGLFV